MTSFHQDLFSSLVLYFIALTAWGLFLYFRGQGPNGSYNGALVIGVGLAVVQALSGLLLVATGHHPKDGLHWLYGFVVVLTLPVVYRAWVQKSSNDKRASLFYALACALVVVIALVRSKATG